MPLGLAGKVSIYSDTDFVSRVAHRALRWDMSIVAISLPALKLSVRT